MPHHTPNVEDAGTWSLGRLLSTAARLVEHDWNAWLEQRHLTHASFLALHALGGGSRTQRELAAACMVEQQTMSRVVKRLETSGYVTRRSDDTDRRRMVVRRTREGTRVYRATINSDIADTLVSAHIGDPEQFREQLTALVTALAADRDGA